MPRAPALAAASPSPAQHPDGPLAAIDAVLRRPERIGVHFQPIVDLSRGVVAGFEALARFASDPALGPDRWFAAARLVGRGAELEAAVLARALDARRDLPPNAFLSLNVDPGALLDDRVLGTLRAAGPLGGVVVEITEQSEVADYDVLRARVDVLRGAGAHLAIDDAGAGFASLRHVTSLRPDFIKIDRALIAGIDADPTKAAVVETLGIFGSRVDAWVVAEGIERPGELRRLHQLGVPLGQGYHLGRPAPTMDVRLPADLVPRRPERARRASDVAVGALVEPLGDDLAVELDGHGRPRGLAVLPTDRITDVARRAMTRDGVTRFAPIACCDELGRLLGAVRVERLVEALAR